MSMKGIDVSSYQKKPDWAKVKKSGVRFAILRIMNSKGKDTSFEHNYKGCRAEGIPVGVYRFSYALSEAQARAEAETMKKKAHIQLLSYTSLTFIYLKTVPPTVGLSLLHQLAIKKMSHRHAHRLREIPQLRFHLSMSS